MLPEQRFNLVAAFESRHTFIREAVATHLGEDVDDALEEEDSSLSWTIDLTSEGVERVPFYQHLHRTDAHKSAAARSSEPKLADLSFEFRLPPKLQLPPELHLRVLDFCSDRTTLFGLMRASPFLRAEASKTFWADPQTYYSVDASWILTGGHPGYTGYNMSFLPLVQNIEIDYGVDADSIMAPRGDDSSSQPIHDMVESFWKVLTERFASVKRMVLYQTSARDPFKVSTYITRLLKACPPSIHANILITSGSMDIVFKRGAIRSVSIVAPAGPIEKSLYRLSDNGELEKVAARRTYQTVLIPMRNFNGPVGQFEKVRIVQERTECQHRGLGATMIEALDRYHFDKDGPGPFDCPMRYCDEHFTQSGQWTLHAALGHVNDLIPGRQFEGWPEELRQRLRRRHMELLRLKEKNAMSIKRIKREWDDAGHDERMEIKQAWLEQLRNDPDWDTGVPAEDSPLWKRFESRMQKW
jgi:hypothetical protein